MHVTPHKGIFNFFKRTIYSKGLKLSEVVYLPVAEILIHVCQLYVYEFFLHNFVFLYSFPLLFLLRSCVMSHIIRLPAGFRLLITANGTRREEPIQTSNVCVQMLDAKR